MTAECDQEKYIDYVYLYPNQIKMLLSHPIIMHIQHMCPFKVPNYVPKMCF